LLVLHQGAAAFDRAAIAPEQISFLLCIEGNGIELQALLLCESIRRFAGRYSGSPIIAVSPRPDVPISARSRERLGEMAVEHVSLPLNQTGSAYLTINRIVAGAWAERHLSTDYIVVLDSDTIFATEPAFFCCDAGARPVDAKGSTSAGPADPKEPYWQRICETAGIGMERLPWIDTTTDNVRIRASFNGGFTVVRRSCGILRKTADVFLTSLRADLRPLRDEGFNVFASTGYVGREASEFWGSSQAALSAAIAAQASELLIYDERYNIPLHLLRPDSANRVAWPRCEPILLHYHWLTQPQYRSDLLSTVRCFKVSDAWLGWLSARLELPSAA
jgi:hypothetical protein